MRLRAGWYDTAWALAWPLALAYLLWRSVRQPAYRQHWGERLGRHPRRVRPGPLIWIHAVSVGETRAAQTLVTALAQACPRAQFVFTAMTPTGREVAASLFQARLGERFAQAYLPYDRLGWQRRFLEAWQPDLGILIETEVWPNLLAAAAAAQLPVALVNARLSERSLRRGQAQLAWVGPAVQRLSMVLAQTEDDARRMAQLGAQVHAVIGNLKFDVTPNPALAAQGHAWRARIGRPVVLAASTREGEEALILAAWRTLTASLTSPPPLLVIVPRHPQRFDAVARAARDAGWRIQRRAALDNLHTAWSEIDVLIGDSMGEMDAWYSLAHVAVIGGSLRPFGAQNLIEACALGCPVILGPSTFNFAAAAEHALAAGAALQVADSQAALAAALAVLADSGRAAAMAAAGVNFAASHRGATARTLAALAPLLSGTADLSAPVGSRGGVLVPGQGIGDDDGKAALLPPI